MIEPMNKEKIIAITKKMHALQRELWSGKKMGECAFALALDGYETGILQAIGSTPPRRRRKEKTMITNSEIRAAINAVYDSLCEHEIIYPKERRRLIEVIDAAFVGQPVRNCEVGSAEAQARRFDGFCKMCDECKLAHVKGLLVGRHVCQFAWAQMPYEEGGAK